MYSWWRARRAAELSRLWLHALLFRNYSPQCLGLFIATARNGRTLQFGEGWHSSENAVRFWTPSPRVPKEADARCYAFTTAYATMIPLCNVFCVQSNTPTPCH